MNTTCENKKYLSLKTVKQLIIVAGIVRRKGSRTGKIIAKYMLIELYGKFKIDIPSIYPFK